MLIIFLFDAIICSYLWTHIEYMYSTCRGSVNAVMNNAIYIYCVVIRKYTIGLSANGQLPYGVLSSGRQGIEAGKQPLLVPLFYSCLLSVVTTLARVSEFIRTSAVHICILCV